jgi:hypothetical protein
VVNYYETVIMIRLEDMTRTEVSAISTGGEEEETKDIPSLMQRGFRGLLVLLAGQDLILSIRTKLV